MRLPNHQLTRRAVLRNAALGLASLPLAPAAATAATKQATGISADRADRTALASQFPNLVHDYYIGRVREVERAGVARRAALRTKHQAEAYVREVREKIAAAFGPFPEKTPLNARVTGVLERDTYTIEKVVFESRPGFLIPANVYLPKDRAGRLPAVLGTCGHGADSKGTATYQSFAQGLARQGYVVLIFDPIGQGERAQFVDAGFSPRLQPIPGNSLGVTEHLHLGKPQLLLGDSLAQWMAWDAIRALDYLLSRPEVDPRHVGVTGNSGGGTQATWLCGLDARITMAAPSCFVTTFRRNIENRNVGDSEQMPPRALALGLDLADFFAAHAPRPLILLGQEKDFFDARGVEEAHARLRDLYRLLDAPQSLRLFVGPDPHGFSRPNREAMYGWFNYVTGRGDSQAEPALTLEKPVDLRCTRSGQVAELGSQSMSVLMRAQAARLEQERTSAGAASLADKLNAALRLPPRPTAPDYRLLRPRSNARFPRPFAAAYGVETEPGILAVAYLLSDERMFHRPPSAAKRAILYVSHLSATAELESESLVRELVRGEPDAALYACDLRGIGESHPAGGDRPFLHPYGLDYFHAMHAWMLDEPYIGRKTHDVLAVLDWLHALGHAEVHLAARGYGTIPAAFAAVLSPRVQQVTLRHALTSYQAVVEADTNDWPVSLFVPGALKSFDLPDCYRALQSKRLRLIEPWDARSEVD